MCHALVNRSAFSLAFEELAAMRRLAPLSIALPRQFRGPWRVLTL
jgi:hypothetical protein